MTPLRGMALRATILPGIITICVSACAREPAPARPFTFAALGDAPYSIFEEDRFDAVLRGLAAADLAWILHVGDIFSHPCSDSLYTRSLNWFNGLPHPVIYTPGDNEWVDCWEETSGGYAPLERLQYLRTVFFTDPAMSLGGRPMRLVSQAAQETGSEFPENVRWTHEGILFATVHIVGSANGMEPFPARTLANDEEAVRRTLAATVWLRETFALASDGDARAVVLAFHGNPHLDGPTDDPYRADFEPFLSTLEDEVERFGKPVLAVHGDYHDYLVDQPLVRRTTGERIGNFTRLQVPGSPAVGWVGISVTADPEPTFSFESHILPMLKHW